MMFLVFLAPLTLLFVAWLFKPAVRERLTDSSKDDARRKFKPEKVPEDLDAIVVGSGIGGMTTASLLAQMGQKVLVLEQHDRIGGCTHTFEFRKNGEMMEFDTGLHYVSADMAKPESRAGSVMNLVTGGLEWTNLGNPWDNVVFPFDKYADRMSYNFWGGKERAAKLLADEINPKEPELEQRIMNMFELCQEAHMSFVRFYVTRVLPPWLSNLLFSKWSSSFHQWAKVTTRDVFNAVLRLGYTVEQVRNGPIPIFTDADEKAIDLTNPREQTWRRAMGVLIHPLGDYACQPRDSAFLAHGVTAAYYMDGASYTVGATQNVSRGAAQFVLNNGGNVLTQARVLSIILNRSKTKAVGVRVCPTAAFNAANENASAVDPTMITYLYAKNIVAATSVYNLYNTLLKPESPWLSEKFEITRKFEPSYGHVFLFVCLKGSPKDLDIPKTNMWYFNSYDTDRAFDQYFENPEAHRPPTVYVGFPCTKDPTWNDRFPNLSNAIMISDAKWDWFAKWANTRTGTHVMSAGSRGKDYEQFKQKLTDHLLSIMYEKVPQTKGHVVFAELGTPLSDAHFLSSFQGGSYGTRCNVEYFTKEASRWLMRGETDVQNLWISGSDAWCPAVSGSMYGGLLCTARMLGLVGSLKMWAKVFSHGYKMQKKKHPEYSTVQAIKAVVSTWK